MPGRVLFILHRVGALTTAAIAQKLSVGAAWVLLLTPVRSALDREMAPFSKDRFTFFTQQRSLSLHARRNPIDVWNVLAAQPHRVVIAKSLLFLGIGITQCR
jgi:hypothetical protein